MAGPPAAAHAALLQVHEPGDARRPAVEAFIQAVFQRRFDARITQFAPTLVALWDEGEVTAAAGYRFGDAGPLFLERYLPAPAERLLAQHGARVPDRGALVEVGHLAASRAGDGRRLMLKLARHLDALGCHWAVATLTAELRQLFTRIGVAQLALGAADSAVLGADAAAWGSYYDHAPVVLASELPLAARRIANYAAAIGEAS